MSVKRRVKHIIKCIPGVKPLISYEKPGFGVIYMLHRCAEHNKNGLYPNENLKISPESLKKFILKKQKSHDFVSLDNVHEILSSGKAPKKPFIALTFDDGYKDNFINAAPILEQLQIPYTIFVTSCFPDYTSYLWWYELEDYIIHNDKLTLSNGITYNCKTKDQKFDSFMEIREVILNLDQNNLKSEMKNLFMNYECAENHNISEYSMTWNMVQQIANSKYGTIGAHTKNHVALSKMNDEDALNEILSGKKDLESKIGKTVYHMAFPYGSAEECGLREYKLAQKAGFKTSVLSYGGTIKNISDFSENDIQFHCLPRKFLSDIIF